MGGKQRQGHSGNCSRVARPISDSAGESVVTQPGKDDSSYPASSVPCTTRPYGTRTRPCFTLRGHTKQFGLYTEGQLVALQDSQ